MPLFCLPHGSAKAKKSSVSKIIEPISNSHIDQEQNGDNAHATGSSLNRYLLRYVTSEFHAKVKDELTVMPDDVVIFQYEDSTGDWSHVCSIKANKSGYVPSKILTELRQVSSARRKKMPRNETNILENNHLLHQNRQHHVIGPAVSSNGDNSRLSDHQIGCGHQHLSNIPHSFQGSTSNQTFSKCHDIGMTERPPATYYNLRAPNHCESYDMVVKPFIRDDFGLFVVMNNFVAREESDLEVQVGDIVRVLNKDDEDWYWVRRECDSEEGFVPAKFIKDLPSIESILAKGNSTLSMKSSNLNAVPTYSNQMETQMIDQQLSSMNPLIGV